MQAPEITRGGKPSPAGDVYAFGISCWLLLAPGFPVAETVTGSGGAVVPQELTETDPELGDLLRRCTEADPARRPVAASLLTHPVFTTRHLVQRAAAREAELRARRRVCEACFESFDLGDGVECGACAAEDAAEAVARHFLCTECLGGYVVSRVDAENFAAFAEAKGRIKCSHHDCDAELSTTAIMRRLDTTVATAYDSARIRLAEQDINARLTAEFDERLKQKEIEWANLSEAERRRRIVKFHITEQILNLACPRCHQTFTDFTGCAALKCSRCPAGFCAYCLADCGADAHAHIATCAARGPFEQVHLQRRKRKLEEYLATLGAQERRDAIADVGPNLRSLGIEVEANAA